MSMSCGPQHDALCHRYVGTRGTHGGGGGGGGVVGWLGADLSTLLFAARESLVLGGMKGV